MESHLLQMRGLKLLVFLINLSISEVASFTDAWIETIQTRHLNCIIRRRSHLLQMRGLKLLVLISARNVPLRRIFYRCVD